MTLRHLPSILIALACALACGPATQAQPTNFGDFGGTTVIYEDVLENSDGLFSAPMISGDTLDFTAAINDFEAESENGLSDSAVGQLNAFIQARPGQSIESFNVDITGLSQFFAFGADVTAATATRALLRITPRVLEAGGAPVFGGSVILAPTEVTLAEFDFVTDGQGEPQEYVTSTTVEVAAAAAAQFDITDPITRILWSIELTLEAESEIGSNSTINLRALDNFTVTVPEPSSLALLGIAGGVVGLRRRRD